MEGIINRIFFTSPESSRRKIENERLREWQEAESHHHTLVARGDCKMEEFGPIENFHLRLDGILGPPKKLLFDAIMKEHCESADSDIQFEHSHHSVSTTSRIEWYFVVDPSADNLKKLNIQHWPCENLEGSTNQPGRRKPTSLENFEKPLAEINDKLRNVGVPPMSMVEVIACRLYTGPLGAKYNRVLRSSILGSQSGSGWRRQEAEKIAKGNSYTTILHLIQSAIAKLGKINPCKRCYSGGGASSYNDIYAMLIPNQFWEENPALKMRGGVCSGFFSMSTNRTIAEYYARGGNGVLYDLEMPTMDRGCEISWLSQYPSEDETVLPPLTLFEVDHIRLETNKYGKMFVVNIRSRMSNSIQIQRPLLTSEENIVINKVMRDDSLRPTLGNSRALSRFSDEKNLLLTGNPIKSVMGLSQHLGIDNTTLQKRRMKGIRAMENEIRLGGVDEMINNMEYVFFQPASVIAFPNGIRDVGKDGLRLKDFEAMEHARESGLTVEHVAALRLYTTSAFSHINAPLRRASENQNEDTGRSLTPHPYPVTVSYIDEGIKLLRGATSKKFKKNPKLKNNWVLYRGIKNTRIDEDFMEHRRGGTELGLMSTTKDLKIAVQYSKSHQGHSLLFKVKVDNMKQLGADIGWLSAFPNEEEILYPPLTFLQPTGSVETITIADMVLTSIEVQPHV